MILENEEEKKHPFIVYIDKNDNKTPGKPFEYVFDEKEFEEFCDKNYYKYFKNPRIDASLFTEKDQ